VCVRADGGTVWEASRPALGNVDGEDVPACAVFPPERPEPWAFVPVRDEDIDVTTRRSVR